MTHRTYSSGEQTSVTRVARLTGVPVGASEAFLPQLLSFLPSLLLPWSYFSSKENEFSSPSVVVITAVHQILPTLCLPGAGEDCTPVPRD